MTVAAWRSLRVGTMRPPADVRVGRIAGTLLISLLAFVVILHVPPFMASGADLSDPSQRDYAENIWQESQTSLALMALVLPWVLYGLLWQGTAWGRRALLALTGVGLVVSTWLALISAASYTALPRAVTGVVDHVDGRVISVRGEGTYYLVLSPAQLARARPLLQPGSSLLLWVSPRGHVGAVSRVVLGD